MDVRRFDIHSVVLTCVFNSKRKQRDDHPKCDCVPLNSVYASNASCLKSHTKSPEVKDNLEMASAQAQLLVRRCVCVLRPLRRALETEYH